MKMHQNGLYLTKKQLNFYDKGDFHVDKMKSFHVKVIIFGSQTLIPSTYISTKHFGFIGHAKVKRSKVKL